MLRNEAGRVCLRHSSCDFLLSSSLVVIRPSVKETRAKMARPLPALSLRSPLFHLMHTHTCYLSPRRDPPADCSWPTRRGELPYTVLSEIRTRAAGGPRQQRRGCIAQARSAYMVSASGQLLASSLARLFDHRTTRWRPSRRTTHTAWAAGDATTSRRAAAAAAAANLSLRRGGVAPHWVQCGAGCGVWAATACRVGGGVPLRRCSSYLMLGFSFRFSYFHI